MAGRQLYASNCASCHGQTGKGTGNVPSLVDGKLQTVTPGEVFWFITKGDKDNGMPSWAALPANQRWQIVSYVKSIATSQNSQEASAPAPADMSTAKLKAPPPTPPFTDFRYEKPGTTRKITVKDLPQPYATQSSDNGPKLVARPENVWPVALPGFKVDLYASGLDNPRTLRTAPNGDIFLTESDPGRIRVFRGLTSDGKPEQSAIFVSGLKRPYGLAFYPPGPDPQWLYVGSEREVVRFAYHNGDLKASGSAGTHCRSARPRRTLDACFSVLPGWQEIVRRRGLRFEHRRSRYNSAREKSCRHSVVRSRELQVECVCLWHS